MKDYILTNLAAVRDEIGAAESAADRKGRTRMVAAVKYADDAELADLLAAGVTDVGENRVQQLLAHAPLYEKSDVRVHFIGSLQTNKVKYIIDKVEMIHSVDSVRLAAEIERQAAKIGRTVPVLVEINGAREESKSGALPEEAKALCLEIIKMPHLSLAGFMTMGPRFESDEEYRAYFAGVRRVGEEIFAEIGKAEPLFSMGMSESFAPAIAAGADLVRVGRRLFAHTATEEDEK